MATVVIGLLITGATKDYYEDFFKTGERGSRSRPGMIIGIIMLLNVWV